jgi:ParB/RepB/Spo0J family partition protein
MIDATDTVTNALPLIKPTPHGASDEALTLVQMADVDPDPRNTLRMTDAELDELGESIDARGLFQPPMLRYDANTHRFTTIDGHHRIEAMRRKGFESFFAMVGEAADDTALEMLIMANIHRKDMSTAQIADFVALSFKKHKSLDKVCAIMKKSKPWVSKHLALTRPDFGAIARQMLTRGECEDLEVLGVISQLEKLEALEAIDELRANPPISRAKARQALKLAKAKPEENPDEDEELMDGADKIVEAFTGEVTTAARICHAIALVADEMEKDHTSLPHRKALKLLRDTLAAREPDIAKAIDDLITACDD